jgi:hypothetical protein
MRCAQYAMKVIILPGTSYPDEALTCMVTIIEFALALLSLCLKMLSNKVFSRDSMRFLVYEETTT